MTLGSRGESILFAYRHYTPSEPNVSLPLPLFTGTAQLLVNRERDQLIIAGAVNKIDLERVSPIVTKELQLYSRVQMEKSGVRQIIFCNGLYSGNLFDLQSHGGLASYRQHAIFFDTKWGRDGLSSATHHEIFHFIDWQMGFSSYDANWIALNPPQHQYLGYRRGYIFANNHSSDFISHYSQASMQEDKAEIYAHLITSPAFIASRAKQSSVLQRKIDCIKQRLLEFCPDFNQTFWDAVSEREKQNATLTRVARTVRDTSHEQLYPPTLNVPVPPISNGLKICIFVGIMLIPWIAVSVITTALSRLRINTVQAAQSLR